MIFRSIFLDSQMQIPVLMFDGRSTAGIALWLDDTNHSYCVLKNEEGFASTFAFYHLRVEAAVSLHELTVWLDEHQFFVIHGELAVSQALRFFKQVNQKTPLKQWDKSTVWSTKWLPSIRSVILMTCVFLAGIWGLYRWVLPWGAYKIAKQVPASIALSIDNATLDTLRASSDFQTSLIPVDRQARIRERVIALGLSTSPSTGMPLTTSNQLSFYRINEMGANAFALPGGNVVITDELMSSMTDDQVIAVLAHEFGHVELKHGLRGIITQSSITLFFGFLVGDVSSLLAMAPTLLLAQKYSREFEREADAFAVRTLEAHGQDPRHLIEALYVLEKKHQSDVITESSHAKWIDVLSSHPDVAERVSLIEQTLNTKTNTKKN
jgi:Zn-dependent protease with chaperone function